MAGAKATDGRQATELWRNKGNFHFGRPHGSLLTLLPRMELSRALTPKVLTSTGPIKKRARDMNIRDVGEHTDGNTGQISPPVKKSAEGQKGPATERQLVLSALTRVDMR